MTCSSSIVKGQIYVLAKGEIFIDSSVVVILYSINY